MLKRTSGEVGEWCKKNVPRPAKEFPDRNKLIGVRGGEE